MDFIKEHIDKLILVFLTLISWGISLYVLTHFTDMVVIAWAIGLGGPILGALLGLITGKALAEKDK